jgi:hypothetical protein
MSTPINIPFAFQVGFPVVAAQHNANNTSIANFCTSLQNGTNFGTGVIGTATIAAGAITTALLADGNVTSIKIQSSVVLNGTPNIGTAIASSITVGTISVPTPASGIVTAGNVVYHLEINAQVASYVLILSDDGKLIEVSNATGVAVTIPPNSSVAFPLGTQITFLQTGAGQITFTPGTGVSLNSNPGTKTRAQWTAATLIKRAMPDTWVAVGDLSA